MMADSELRLTGKVAIVTGGGRGIGRAIALALADEGAAVVAASRTLSEVEQTAAMLRARGQRALAVAADVSDWQAVQELVARALQEFNGIHILVNDAGVQGPIGPLVENDVEHWLRTIEVNLVGTFLCCKTVAPIMIRQRWGRIINLSGGGATGPRPNFSAYAASKAAVVRLTETLAKELKPSNVLVNAIAPGAVNTRLLNEVLEAGERAGPQELAEAQKRQAEGSTDPAIAAELAVFLASDAAEDISGRLLSALHDPWRAWAAGEKRVPPSPWLTLRRVDPYTIRPLMHRAEEV
jgi:3-oxoacyl-[acyl-carrier protein] reductase